MKHALAYKPIEDGHALAQAIVDTIREPLLVLDSDLRVVTASQSFYAIFRMQRHDVQGRAVYALADGRWNLPGLRTLLEKVLPQQGVVDSYAVEHETGGVRRTLLLDARKMIVGGDANRMILLAMNDVTEHHTAEQAARDSAAKKDFQMREMQHRITNSLQIIASILLLKARSISSEETRLHLRDAYQRVVAIATAQRQLQFSEYSESIEVRAYLSQLCDTLAASMTGEVRPVAITLRVGSGMLPSATVTSIGLIVTELVINALKHAFPLERTDGRIVVSYQAAEGRWKLSVTDNGGGIAAGLAGKTQSGVGTGIIAALVRQLSAEVAVSSSVQGYQVCITYASA